MRDFLDTLTPAIADDEGTTEGVAAGSGDSDAESEDEESKMAAAVKDSLESEAAKKKREKRRKAKMKSKLRERLALKMDLPDDHLDMPEESSLFSLDKIKNKQGLDAVDQGEVGICFIYI